MKISSLRNEVFVVKTLITYSQHQVQLLSTVYLIKNGVQLFAEKCSLYFLNKSTSRYPFYEYEEMFSRYEILILDLEISHKIMYFFRVFAQDFRPYQLLLAFLVSL